MAKATTPTPLDASHVTAGAQFRAYHGWRIPETFGDEEREYRALVEAAGVYDLTFRGKIAATGADRVDFLHRMLTNEVKSLQPGEGNYCFLLNAQGHILADLNLLVEPGRLLLDCEPFLTGKLVETLNRFIIMDEVELQDLSPDLGTIAIEGPRSAEVVSEALEIPPPSEPLAHHAHHAHLASSKVHDHLVVRAGQTGVGFWVIAGTERIPRLWEQILDAARAVGGRAVGFRSVETARIEAGIPRYGADIEEQNLPPETGQIHAFSFTKGCYPGQEILERVRARGHVNRKLVGLVGSSATVMAAGMKVHAAGREAGYITSGTHSPALGKPIALAYIRRGFFDAGTQVEVGGSPAVVASLPFRA